MIREISRYKHSPIQATINWLRAYLLELFSAREIRLFGLADPYFGRARMKQYVSKEMADRFYRKYNPADFVLNIADKSIFASICLKKDIPTPRTMGVYLNSKVIKLQLNEDSSQNSCQLNEFIDDLEPGEYLIKPNNGILGLGLSVLSKNNDGFLIYQDKEIVADGLQKCLENLEEEFAHSREKFNVDIDFQGLLFQERVENHDKISTLTGFRMLQTVRICTYINDTNEVEILFSFLKLAGQEGLADAFNLGKTGNMLANIDADTGKILDVFAMDLQETYFINIRNHPHTNVDFKDFTVPFWEECKSLARELSVVFLPLRAIGWDIAITNKGPLVLEGNEDWVPVVPFQISLDKLRRYGLKS